MAAFFCGAEHELLAFNLLEIEHADAIHRHAHDTQLFEAGVNHETALASEGAFFAGDLVAISECIFVC